MAAFIVVAFFGSGCSGAAVISGVGDGRGALGVAAFVVVAFFGSGCSGASRLRARVAMKRGARARHVSAGGVQRSGAQKAARFVQETL